MTITTVPQHGEQAVLPLSAIDTRAQIRTRNGFDQSSLEELAASIRVRGILQPLVVARAPRADGSDSYILVAGERRLIAASMAGLDVVPVIIRNGTELDLAADQAVENLQREDLHPADIADGLVALAGSMGGSWREVARAIGKSPAWVSKHRALSRLHPELMQALRENITTDLDLLLTLQQIARMKTDAAKVAFARHLRQLAAGTCTRAGARDSLASLKGNPDQVDGDGEEEEEDAPTAKPRATLVRLALTREEAECLFELVNGVEWSDDKTELKSAIAKLSDALKTEKK